MLIVGGVIVHALVGVAAAGVNGVFVFARRQPHSSPLCCSTEPRMWNSWLTLPVSSSSEWALFPHKCGPHKAGLGGQIARKAKPAHAAAVGGQGQLRRKLIFGLARAEVPIIVQVEHLKREKGGLLVKYPAGLSYTCRPSAVDSSVMQPVRSAIIQCSAARGYWGLKGRFKRLAPARSSRASARLAQRPSSQGNQLKLRNVLLSVGRGVVIDRVAHKVQPSHAQPGFVDGIVVQRIALCHVGHAQEWRSGGSALRPDESGRVIARCDHELFPP